MAEFVVQWRPIFLADFFLAEPAENSQKELETMMSGNRICNIILNQLLFLTVSYCESSRTIWVHAANVKSCVVFNVFEMIVSILDILDKCKNDDKTSL